MKIEFKAFTFASWGTSPANVMQAILGKRYKIWLWFYRAHSLSAYFQPQNADTLNIICKMQPAKQRFSLKQSLRLTNSMYLCHLQLPSFYKQTNIVWVDFFSSKNKSSWVFAPKKKTKCITAEKLFFYLGQYKFEAYSVFKYKHVCYLFSLRKQYKTCKISVGKNWHTKL